MHGETLKSVLGVFRQSVLGYTHLKLINSSWRPESAQFSET